MGLQFQAAKSISNLQSEHCLISIRYGFLYYQSRIPHKQTSFVLNVSRTHLATLKIWQKCVEQRFWNLSLDWKTVSAGTISI